MTSDNNFLSQNYTTQTPHNNYLECQVVVVINRKSYDVLKVCLCGALTAARAAGDPHFACVVCLEGRREGGNVKICSA